MPPDLPYASHPLLTHQLLQETDLSICMFKVLHGDSSMRATRLLGPPHTYPTQAQLYDLPVSELSLVAVITVIGDHDQPSTVSPVTVVIPLHLHLGSFVASDSCSLSAQVTYACVCVLHAHICVMHIYYESSSRFHILKHLLSYPFRAQHSSTVQLPNPLLVAKI